MIFALHQKLAQTVQGHFVWRIHADKRCTFLFTILLVALGAGCGNLGSAWAEENCLPAPNARAPQGSHWFFHTDRATQRKCWSLKKEGEAASTGATAVAPATGAKITPDQTLAPPQANGVPSDPAGLRGSLGPAKPDNDSGRREATPNTAWPAPESSAAPKNFAWPEPLPPPQSGAPVGSDTSSSVTGTSPGSATNNPPAETTQMKEDSSAAPPSRKEVESDFMPGTTDPVERVAPYGRIPTGVLFVAAFGLVIAGVFVRRILIKTLQQRRVVGLLQGKSRSNVARAGQRLKSEIITPDDHSTASAMTKDDRYGDESKEALRRLLIILEQ